jgi:hypothetical protein
MTPTRLFREWIRSTTSWSHVLRELSPSGSIANLFKSRDVSLNLIDDKNQEATDQFRNISLDDVIEAIAGNSEIPESLVNNNEAIRQIILNKAQNRQRGLKSGDWTDFADKVHCESLLVCSVSIEAKVRNDITHLFTYLFLSNFRTGSRR